MIFLYLFSSIMIQLKRETIENEGKTMHFSLNLVLKVSIEICPHPAGLHSKWGRLFR